MLLSFLIGSWAAIVSITSASAQPAVRIAGAVVLAEEIHALLTCSTCCPTSIPVVCWARKSGHFGAPVRYIGCRR